MDNKHLDTEAASALVLESQAAGDHSCTDTNPLQVVTVISVVA